AIVLRVEPRPEIDGGTMEAGPFCSDDQGGNMATIDLTQYDAAINPDPEGTSTEYYANMDDYNNGYPIEDPTAAEVQDGQTVIAVVVDDQTLCSSLEQVEIHISVEARPMVDISIYDGSIICVDLDPVTTPTEGGGAESITLDTGLPASGYEFEWQL